MADHHVAYINIYTNSKHWFNIWVKFLDFDSVTSEQLPSEQLQVGQVDHQIALGGSVEAPEWGGWAKPAGPVVEGPFFFVGSWFILNHSDHQYQLSTIHSSNPGSNWSMWWIRL